MTYPDLSNDIENNGNDYAKLTKQYSTYQKSLCRVIDEREIYKQRSFDESKLNIHLDKFSGYDSTVDIYTFQTNFNKLYLRSTPKKVLPDLLKNNLLKDPAFSLVKSLTDIDDIWKQLKSAYGDTKMLLSRKLHKLSKFESLARVKDPGILTHALNNLINILNELMTLAKDHHIEDNLFYGDGLDRIYNMLGDVRLTKWLSSIADEELSPKTTWLRLIRFLEKERKLQEQKMHIYTKNNAALSNPPNPSAPKNTPRNAGS